MSRKTRVLLEAVGVAVFVLLLVILEQELHLSRLLQSDRIEEQLVAAGPFAPLVFILVMGATVLSPVPTFPLDILAGRVFGPVPGALYAAIGASLGAMGSFLVARWLGRDLIVRFLKGHINFCERCSNRLITRVVFLARLVPAVSFDMVSYGAGLTKVSLTRFAVASFLGMLPLTFVYTSIGPSLSISPVVGIIGGGAVVTMYFVLPRWIERYDPFAMRSLFQHDEKAAEPPAARPLGHGDE